MPPRFSNGRCSLCKQDVYLAFLPSSEQGETGRTIMTLGRTPLPGAVVVPASRDTLEAWTREGRLVHVRTCAQTEREGSGTDVYVDHRLSCPAERRRQQRMLDAPEPPRMIYPESIAGDVATCSRCEASILWIYTAKGKKAPVDLEPYVGVLLSREEASELKGSDELVRGFRTNGGTAAIRKCAPEDPAAEGREITTVYVAHFATCAADEPASPRASA